MLAPSLERLYDPLRPCGPALQAMGLSLEDALREILRCFPMAWACCSRTLDAPSFLQKCHTTVYRLTDGSGVRSRMIRPIPNFLK